MKIILSLDGGGIRGIIPISILSYLEEQIQEITKDPRIKIGSLVDFVSGTSTGSIIGGLMLIPDENKVYPKYKMTEILESYFALGNKVFKNSFLHNIKTIWGLFGPQFPKSNIEEPLLTQFDHYKLKDLLKPCMFSGYDIDKRKVLFFTNKDKGEKYADYYLKDIIRGSTAIPSYFEPAHFNYGININTIADGGLFANNPSLSSFIEISKTIFENQSQPTKYTPQDIMIISLGTGDINQKSYKYKKVKKWGKAEWIVPLIDILLTANSEVTDYEIQKLFSSYDSSNNYKRINPPIKLASDSALDASKENLTNLLKDANNYINENKEMLNTLAKEICDINFIFKP